MFPAQPADISVVRFKYPEIRNRRREALTGSRMTRGVTVTAEPGLGEREINHRSQQQNCREERDRSKQDHRAA